MQVVCIVSKEILSLSLRSEDIGRLENVGVVTYVGESNSSGSCSSSDVSSSDVASAPRSGGGDRMRPDETYSKARCVGEGIRRGRSEVRIEGIVDECSSNGSPPRAASNSFISASKRAIDDIGLSPSNREAGELAKNRSNIVSRRPGTDPTGAEPFAGVEPVRVLGHGG